MLIEYYGRTEASTIMPESFIFPRDKDIFDKKYKWSNYYVIKSEKQKQEGLDVTNNYNIIINSRQNGYKIVQKYIDNPYTYKGYKVNFRIYLLLVCEDNMKIGYVYKDGITSYAKNICHNNKINFSCGVASFYTSKQLYDKNFPITFNEFRMQNSNVNWNLIFKKFIMLIKKVLIAGKSRLCYHGLSYNNRSFQIFGIDYILTKNLVPYILEINIGPGMSPYCHRDKKMRIKLHEDILNTVGINGPNNKSNNFIKIIN
jgi:hypothetical protein